MSKTMGPCHLSHPLDTHPGKQQQQPNLMQCALLTLETKTFCFQRHLNCHENLQFIPGKTYPGFTGNDKGRDDVQSTLRNVQEKNSTVWWEPRQSHLRDEVI